MSWYCNMLMPLRVLINDFGDNPEHTDETLKRVLTVAASYVQKDIPGVFNYTINFSSSTITPEDVDTDFAAFVVMKAACMTNMWQFNAKAVAQGIRAVCGPVSMSVDSGGASILLALIQDGYCKAYETMRRDHIYGNVANIRAVLSPFSHSDVDTESYRSSERGVFFQ